MLMQFMLQSHNLFIFLNYVFQTLSITMTVLKNSDDFTIFLQNTCVEVDIEAFFY
jgi:hypothetical protein